MLDRSRCGRCGQPTWLSHDKANRKAFKVKAERCHSCNAMDEHPLVRSEDVLNPNAIRFSTEYVGEF